MTAFYSWRLLFMTFHGAPRASPEVMAHVHESPKVMTLPLVALAIGAVVAGYLGFDAFVGEGRAAFWGTAILVLEENDAIEAAYGVPLWVKLLPLVMGAGGIALAWIMYVRMPSLPGLLAARLRPLYLFLLNKWYFDELYDWAFVRPATTWGVACGSRATARSSTGSGPTAWRRRRWCSRAGPAACRPATSTTTPSPC